MELTLAGFMIPTWKDLFKHIYLTHGIDPNRFYDS